MESSESAGKSVLSAQNEAVLLMVILFAAFFVRTWQAGHVSVEHFDEGVYASNYVSSHLDFRYPDRHLYAPPFLPAVLEWILILSGGTAHAVIWCNLVTGTLLVAAIWWITRIIGGQLAALSAASLVAFSDYFIQYSRAVLTDTPLTLFLVLAVACGVLAMREVRYSYLVTSALFTALAWWTKYNGWLPLAILGAGLAGWILFTPPARSDWWPAARTYLIIFVASVLFWLPYLNSLQPLGGYSTVAENHRGYLVGLSGWIDSISQQIAVQQHYSKLLPFGLLVSITSCLIIFQYRFISLLSLLLISGLGILSLGLTFWLVVIASVIGISERYRRDRKSLDFWILLAWVTGLYVTTPLYRPYPRLMLPLMTSLMIAAGIGISSLTQKGLTDRINVSPARLFAIATIIFCGCLPVVFSPSLKASVYADRSQFYDIAQQIHQEVVKSSTPLREFEGVNAIIYVIGEPGLYYHLGMHEPAGLNVIVQPSSSFGMLERKAGEPPLPTFVVFGPHAQLNDEIRAALQNNAQQLQSLTYLPSDLVLLDAVSPDRLEQNREKTIELWKFNRY